MLLNSAIPSEVVVSYRTWSDPVPIE